MKLYVLCIMQDIHQRPPYQSTLPWLDHAYAALVTMPLVTMPCHSSLARPCVRHLSYHAPKAVTYHEQSHYCRFMIGHSLGRIDTSYFLTAFFFRLYEVVSLHMRVLPYTYRKILDVLLKSMALCDLTGSRAIPRPIC